MRRCFAKRMDSHDIKKIPGYFLSSNSETLDCLINYQFLLKVFQNVDCFQQIFSQVWRIGVQILSGLHALNHSPKTFLIIQTDSKIWFTFTDWVVPSLWIQWLLITQSRCCFSLMSNLNFIWVSTWTNPQNLNPLRSLQTEHPHRRVPV